MNMKELGIGTCFVGTEKRMIIKLTDKFQLYFSMEGKKGFIEDVYGHSYDSEVWKCL